jgi:hypothetical protein
MYAAIRQGKAKAGMAEELARGSRREPSRSSAMCQAFRPIT